MKRPHFLAFDLGATSGRTILASFDGERLDLRELNRFPNHLIQLHRHFYWDIYELYRQMLEGLTLAAQTGEHIVSVGIDTWGVDFTCVGDDGQLLRPPYAYRDPHTAGAPARFFERMPRHELYARTGIQIMDFNTLFQLDTLRLHRDSALQAARKLLFVPDALAYLLTGEMVTEYTIASTSQLLDVHTRRFDPALLAAVGLDESCFGRFVQPGEPVGTLTAEVCRLTGMEPVPVVAVAGHDTASAVAAVPAADADFAYLSSGTWSLMGVETHAPVATPQAEELNFTNEGGVEGTTRLLKNICGMWLLERCRAKWGDASYEQLLREADACEPFRSLVDPDDPAFANPDDMETALADYCRRTRQPVPTRRGETVRCIFESLALRYRQVMENLRALSPHAVNTLHVIGGGSRNPLLNQYTANALQMPVVAGPAEATAIGNVMMQAIAAGMAANVAEMRRVLAAGTALQRYLPREAERWDEAYARYTERTRQTN